MVSTSARISYGLEQFDAQALRRPCMGVPAMHGQVTNAGGSLGGHASEVVGRLARVCTCQK